MYRPGIDPVLDAQWDLLQVQRDRLWHLGMSKCGHDTGAGLHDTDTVIGPATEAETAGYASYLASRKGLGRALPLETWRRYRRNEEIEALVMQVVDHKLGLTRDRLRFNQRVMELVGVDAYRVALAGV